jgi:hypothetical protein
MSDLIKTCLESFSDEQLIELFNTVNQGIQQYNVDVNEPGLEIDLPVVFQNGSSTEKRVGFKWFVDQLDIEIFSRGLCEYS